jgi:hypothetical protein
MIVKGSCRDFRFIEKSSKDPSTFSSNIVRCMRLKHTWSLTFYDGRFLNFRMYFWTRESLEQLNVPWNYKVEFGIIFLWLYLVMWYVLYSVDWTLAKNALKESDVAAKDVIWKYKKKWYSKCRWCISMSFACCGVLANTIGNRYGVRRDLEQPQSKKMKWEWSV